MMTFLGLSIFFAIVSVSTGLIGTWLSAGDVDKCFCSTVKEACPAYQRQPGEALKMAYQLSRQSNEPENITANLK